MVESVDLATPRPSAHIIERKSSSIERFCLPPKQRRFFVFVVVVGKNTARRKKTVRVTSKSHYNIASVEAIAGGVTVKFFAQCAMCVSTKENVVLDLLRYVLCIAYEPHTVSSLFLTDCCLV